MTIRLITFIFLALYVVHSKEKMLENFPESETYFLVPSFKVCECEYPSKHEFCKDFQNWTFIKDGFIQTPTNDDKQFELKEEASEMCTNLTKEDSSLCRKILHAKWIALFGTGNITILSYPLNGKKNIVLCPKSLGENLKEILFVSVDDVFMSPDSIMRRTASLILIMHNVKGNTIFPTGFYDYGNENDTQPSETFSVEPIFEITLLETGNVIFEENSIRAKSVNLHVQFAKSLTFLWNSIIEEYPSLQSLIRDTISVKLQSSCGILMSIENCMDVSIFPNAFSNSIQTLKLRHIEYLKTYHSSFDFNQFRVISICNVSSWMILDEIISLSDQSDRKSNILDHLQDNPETPNVTKEQTKSILIEDTNISFEGQKQIEIASDNIALQNLSLTQTNYSNITVVFTSESFQLTEEIFPGWVYFCQINKSVVCNDYKKLGNICSKESYLISNSNLSLVKDCIDIFQQVKLQYTRVITDLIHVAVGVCALLLIILIIYASILAHRHRKLSGKWTPKNVNSSYRSTWRPTAPSMRSQVVHVPPSDSQISFKFPSHFPKYICTPINDTVSTVQFHSYEDLRRHREEAQRDMEKNLKKLTVIQLLNVRPVVEDCPPQRLPIQEDTQDWLREYPTL